jgi:hypothetical protein
MKKLMAVLWHMDFVASLYVLNCKHSDYVTAREINHRDAFIQPV